MPRDEAGFAINLDRTHSTLIIKFSGFWTLKTVQSYEQARQEAVKRSGIPPSRLRLLVDRRGQSAQVTAHGVGA